MLRGHKSFFLAGGAIFFFPPAPRLAHLWLKLQLCIHNLTLPSYSLANFVIKAYL